ncbi:MAG TPA: AMP-binding protein [Streptosporangiaceae bacterium]
MDESGTPLGVAFGELAAKHPDDPAVTHDDVTVSFAELERSANQWARVLAAHGAGQDSLVSIALPNSIAFYAAALGAWKLGAVPQPVSYRLPPGELAALIEVADPAVVVGLEAPDGRPWLPADFAPDASVSAAPLPPAVPPSWKAPTSGGSTGRPKVIVAGGRGVYEEVTSRAPSLRIEPDGVFLCTGPLYHNAPFMFSLMALMLHNHVVVMGRFDAERSLALAEEHRVTWFYAVPTMMSRILKLSEERRLAYDLSSVRTVFHLAAPCPPAVKRAWIDWLGPARIMELYAGTESQSSTIISGDEWLAHPGSVGRVVSGEMVARDAEGGDLPPGEVGEIWMRPPSGVTTYHYLGATANARDGWESLGDMGHFDADGYLYLADRRGDMILVGGSNVYPAEVEAALIEHPRVVSAAVIGLPDDDYGNVVHAIIETDGDVSDDELRAHLEPRLVRYKIPRTFERTDRPLRDDAGKVRRSALRAARLPR